MFNRKDKKYILHFDDIDSQSIILKFSHTLPYTTNRNVTITPSYKTQRPCCASELSFMLVQTHTELHIHLGLALISFLTL